MERCPQHVLVAIPLHGPSKDIHDMITRADGSFSQTLMGITNLLSAGIDVEIRVVVSKLNYRSLKEISELIIERFPIVRVVNFIGLETLGNCAKNISQVYLKYEEAFAYIKPAIDLLVEHGIDTALYNYPLCMVDRGYWQLCKKSISGYKIRYKDECDSCEAKSGCGGFFSSTLAVAKPIVQPISFYHNAGDRKA
jgi:His-Xaa-Ser system radical SAM maturase HxsC